MTETLSPKSGMLVPAIFVMDVWRSALMRGHASQVFAEGLAEKMQPFSFDREGWRELFARHDRERSYDILFAEIDRIFSVR